ncbi:hypothetical protein [Natronococcus wangiae]|uniref:hypothetical protein n=1 Tax=Natronococcus wangiae TaxID=3068275 RepID=UPI003133B424
MSPTSIAERSSPSSTREFVIDRLVRIGLEVYVLGLAVALVVGTTVAVVTGWHASRSATLASLES